MKVEGHDFEWWDWGEAAFVEARRTDRLILLHIGATWCHWCHVMDQGSYPHPRVAALLRERFVPVRVDTDAHPDVNDRYNHGGWPTVAVLDASGEVLVGRTYATASELLGMLQSVVGSPGRWVVTPERPMVSAGPPLSVEAAAEAVRAAFDPHHGGFGELEKFPHPAIHEWLLDRHLRGQGDGGMLAPSLDALALRGVYDTQEGGWYRYATRDDWEEPHYEKLLEDQARLVALYARAAWALGREDWRRAAEGAVRWTLATLWVPGQRGFGGSQDADEDYHRRALALRAAPPAVDGTVYAGWNGLWVVALVRAAAAWGRPGLAAVAEVVGRTLLGRVEPEGRVVRAGSVAGLLDDQVQVADAFLALGAWTGAPEWFDAAGRCLGWALEHLAAPEGGFLDRVPDGPGRLGLPRRPMLGNAAAALVAGRYAALAGELAWRTRAIGAAEAALREAHGWRHMAAAAAMAWERVSRPVVVVKVHDRLDLLATFLADPHPQVLARAVRGAEAEAAGVPAGRAQACTALACGRPAEDAESVRRSVRMLLGVEG